MSTSPKLSEITIPKTSLIISNLNKEDFVKPSSSQDSQSTKLISKNLALVDQIKLKVLNFEDDIASHISHWSNLPFLSRVIVIFQNETTAKKIFEFLTKELAKFDDHYSYIKIHLQENLLQKSKSSDNLHDCQNEKLNVTKSLNNFRNFHNDPKNEFTSEYVEPEPAKFNVYNDLANLGIDLSQYNSAEQLEELKQLQQDQNQDQNQKEVKNSRDGNSPLNTNSLPVQLGRRKSTTKTLFKPELKLNTTAKPGLLNEKQKEQDFVSFPTITLDETF